MDVVHSLTDATEFVVARVRQIVSPRNGKWEVAVLSIYGKALKNLQGAIGSPVERFELEVLCAREILALYEVCQKSICLKHILYTTPC